MRTANPALNDKIFAEVQHVGAISGSDVMTLEGTVNKAAISIAITMIAGYWSYSRPDLMKFFWPCIIGALVVFFVTMFKKNLAPYTTPIYAVLEGIALGGISLLVDLRYPGIAFQAISLTFATLAALLFAYKSGLIQASENFKLGVVAATGGIFIVYLLSFVLSMFGIPMEFLHGNGLLSIGISAFVIVIAALNLVLDFDFIENASNSGTAPKYMEWFAALGLLVTLVWLYIEILHLLSKLQSRN